MRKEYSVFIGKNETKEIDFVGVKQDKRIYVQVCRRLPDDSDREINNLLELNDNFPKYIVTMDEMDVGNVNGVQIIHLMDFLLMDSYE